MANPAPSQSPSTGQGGQPQVPSLRVDLGFTGTSSLLTAPITEIQLDAPERLEVKQLQEKVRVTGRAKGFGKPSIQATLTWIVQYAWGDVGEFSVPGAMHVAKDGRFEFKAGRPEGPAPLDVLEHRLFGSGKIGFRLTPMFPYAPSATIAPDAITFKNQLYVERVSAPNEEDEDEDFVERVKHAVGWRDDTAIGTRVGFRLRRDPLVDQLLKKGYAVRLVISEEDGSKQNRKLKKDAKALHIELSWTQENKDEELPWVVGCGATSTSEAPFFEYPLVNDVGSSYEFTSELFIAPPQSKVKSKPFAVPQPPGAPLSVPRPALASFALEIAPHPDHHAPSIVAWGTISNLAPHVVPHVQVSLWRGSDKRSGRFTRVGGPVSVPVHRGGFEAELYAFPARGEFCAQDALWGWAANWKPAPETSQPQPALFATVSFDPKQLSRASLPVHASLDFDPESFDTFAEDKGTMSSLAKGSSLCSSESRDGPGTVEALRTMLESYYEGGSAPATASPGLP